MGSGHRDDAMLGLIDLRGKVADVIKCDQNHYRERRDLMSEIDDLLRDAQVSWRYGEIADALNENTAGQIAARLRGEA